MNIESYIFHTVRYFFFYTLTRRSLQTYVLILVEHSGLTLVKANEPDKDYCVNK